MIKHTLLLLALLCTLTFASQQTSPEEERLLKLSLKVMLYNQDLKHGLEIAKKGAEAMPDKQFWYQQAAQIALWLGESKTAKHYYLLLYHLDRSKQTEETLMKLAMETHDTETKITLLKSHIQNHYDPQTVETLYRFFYDMGYLEEGSEYFYALLKRHPRKEVAKAALLLLIEFADFKTVTRRYRAFQNVYGSDKTLTYRYAKILFSRRAYLQAFIELDPLSKQFTPDDKKAWHLYADLALILRNESTLLTVMKKMEHYGLLRDSDKGLYLTLLKRYDPSHALRFAFKLYKSSPESGNFYTVAYLAIDQKQADLLEKVLAEIPLQLKQKLAKQPDYYRILAWYHATRKENPEAIAAYRNALKLAPLDENLHLSYLWMLIDTQSDKALQKELHFIEQHIGCRDTLALPAALGYLRLGEGEHARRCIEKVLSKESDNWQHLLLYADILSLCGRTQMQEQIMRKAWLIAQKELKKVHNITIDKSKYYDYMRLKLHFDPLHAGRYLRHAEQILDKASYIDLALSVTDLISSPQKLLMLLNRLPQPSPSQQLTKALLQQNATQLQLVAQKRETLPLSDRLTLLEQTGRDSAYTTLLFQAMKKNPDNRVLTTRFTERITQKPPRMMMEAASVKRGSLKEARLTLQMQPLPQKSDNLRLSYTQSHFHQSRSTTHRHASLTLEEAFLNYHLQVSAGWNQKDSDYASYEIKTGWQDRKYEATLSYNHHADDDSNNHMLLYGYKNSIGFTSAYRLDAATLFTLNYSHNRYQDSNTTLGSGDLFELACNRYLFLSYPDIYYRLFLSGADFSKSSRLPDDYWQGGVEAGFGTMVQNRFQSVARPYATATLLYNSITGPGYAILAGTGQRLFYHDRLGLELYYASGIDTRDETYMLLRLRYLYW